MRLLRLIRPVRHPIGDWNDITVKDGVNLAALGARGDHDAGDKLPDGVHCLVPIVGMIKGFRQSGHLAAVELGDVGM